MRKKIKRIVPFVLVGVLASSFVMTNYNKAREAKAVVGVDDLAIAGLVTTLLLAYGYATTQYYNNTDGANALADEWEEEYNQARLTVINGGGGSDNGDDDDKNKFEDTDGDGKITEKDIPPFSNFLTKNAVTLSANASLLLTPIVTKFIISKFGNSNTDSSDIDNLRKLNNQLNDYVASNNIDLSNYKYTFRYLEFHYYSSDTFYYDLYEYHTNNGGVFFGDSGSMSIFLVSDDTLFLHCRNGKYYNGKDATISEVQYKKGLNVGFSEKPFYCYWNGNSFSDNSINEWKTCISNNNFSNRVDWVTPELQDTFDNKGNLELLPSFDPSANYSMASQQALQELLSNLANSSLAPVQQLDLVNKFIASLKTSETPDPSPNPDPSPEPNPNPDPSNPDNGDGDNSGDSDVDKGSFVRDLRNLFPFCIPFDLIDCIRLFDAEPVTPRVEIPMHFAFVDVDYTWTIDLKDFNGVATVCRSMFLILFIVGLVLITRNLIRG